MARSNGAIRSHVSPVSEGAWNGSRMEAKLGDAPARVLRKTYAWADPGEDQNLKTAYKFVHHEIGSDAHVGPANVRACTSGIGVLNGARGGAAIPPSDRRAVYNHLARHLRDAGHEPPPLKS